MEHTEPAISNPGAPDQPEDGTRATPDATPAPDVESAPASDAEPPRGRRRIAMLAAVAASIYVLDLITKIIVVETLERENRTVEVIGEWLTIDVLRNSGAAFGMGQGMTILFTCIAAIVVGVIVRLSRKLYSLPWALALGGLLGGALGNLTDRVFRSPGGLEGHVVDFVAPKYFAVFNVADSAIVCGGILIVLLSFRGLNPDGTVTK